MPTGELAKTDTIDTRLLAMMARLFHDRLHRYDQGIGVWPACGLIPAQYDY